MVRIGDFGGVKLLRPCLHGGNDFALVVLAEFDLGTLADVVLRLFEKIQKLGDRLAVDLLDLLQRTALIGDPVNPAMHVVAPWIAQMVLKVTDELLAPVTEIDGAIWRHADCGRTEIWIIRGNEIFRDGLAYQAGTLLRDLHAPDPLETDDVAVQEIPLPVVWEMSAGEDVRAGSRTRWTLPEFLHARVLAFVQVT